MKQQELKNLIEAKVRGILAEKFKYTPEPESVDFESVKRSIDNAKKFLDLALKYYKQGNTRMADSKLDEVVQIIEEIKG
jgi:Tfp pilus assembly protein PilF